MIISVKLNLSLLDKSKIFVGQKGKYIDITLLENREGVPDQYGNSFMVVQDLGKEARLAGQKGPILGNGRIMGQRSATPPAQEPASQPRYKNESGPQDGPEDDLSF